MRKMRRRGKRSSPSCDHAVFDPIVTISRSIQSPCGYYFGPYGSCFIGWADPREGKRKKRWKNTIASIPKPNHGMRVKLRATKAQISDENKADPFARAGSGSVCA